ncbi:hypothetical protein [Spongiactinospora sp. TRM90649]|uniref:hypothetical protein n=1 Tax=Spongiactinospora sp. TRM90649 TaxID=3031114 RepID=UPI0023F71119|nr:hypothetical protein [Spongiactinospora sp. TRM90649]MDF5757441.1 hypothetical protein [Spongiactinospora sp. TRM90649]
MSSAARSADSACSAALRTLGSDFSFAFFSSRLALASNFVDISRSNSSSASSTDTVRVQEEEPLQILRRRIRQEPPVAGPLFLGQVLKRHKP